MKHLLKKMEYGSYKMNKQKKFQLKLLFKFQKKE